MKNTILVAIAGIALGFGIAWIMKSDDQTASAETEKSISVKSPNSSAKPKESRVTTRVTETRRTTDQEDLPQVATRANRGDPAKGFMSRMKDRQKAKIDTRIARLVKKLNLTPAQEAELRALWEKKSEGFADLLKNGDGMKNAEEIAKIMSGDALDDLLKPLLTEEQKEKLAALENREFENRVESRALKGLAKLSFLDLRDEQKDAVMEILYDQAEASEKKTSKGNAMMSLMTEGLGIEIDMEDFGFDSIIEQQIEAGKTGGQESVDIVKMMQESSEKRIDEKVEALAPILDDDQLERYREDLESKSGGFLGGILGGFRSQQELEIPVEKTD